MDDGGGSCKAPDGEQYTNFGLSPKTITFVIAPLIAIIPAFVLFGIPALWSAVGSLVGAYVRRKTEGRRDPILGLIDNDVKALREKGGKEEGETLSKEATQGEHHSRWEGSRPVSLRVRTMLTSL